MRSVSCCTRLRFYFIRASEKKFNWLELFFQSLANDDVKVNKIKNFYVKTFRTRLIVWILKEILSEFAVELRKIKYKDNVMETFMSCPKSEKLSVVRGSFSK